MATIFRILLLIAFFCFNQTLARQRSSSTTTSLVLGLSHSRAKSTSANSKTIATQALDLMEPLREVRDGYLISIYLGTSPQVIQVYMDTGNDLTWIPCGNLSFSCMECDDYRNNLLNPAFSPSSSSSSSSSLGDLCASPFCIDIHSSDNPLDPYTMAGCSLASLIRGTCPRPCPSFSCAYGVGGVVAGTLSRDTLGVHGISSNVTQEIPNFCFGCIGSTFREPIGIVGFGRGPLSLPSQLGFLHKGFSHCFLEFKYVNNPNISSPLVIGDVAISSKENLQFTPMLKSPIYPNNYYIGLEAITIGSNSSSAVTQVPSSLREFDSQGNGGLLIDSGTTYTHLPEPFYSDLLSVLQSVITYPRAKEMEMKTSFDLCYKVPYTTNIFTADLFPSITFHFLNNVSLVLPLGNHFYAMGAPINSTVVKCLLFQTMGDGNYGPAGVFGSFQQQNVEVVYDLEKERIGFQAMDCASAAASQGLHTKTS